MADSIALGWILETARPLGWSHRGAKLACRRSCWILSGQPARTLGFAAAPASRCRSIRASTSWRAGATCPCEHGTWGRESLLVRTYCTAVDGLGQYDHQSTDEERWIDGNGTRVEITGRIDQQSWDVCESHRYKTVLVANEIMIVRSPSSAADVAEAPRPAADDAAQSDTDFRTDFRDEAPRHEGGCVNERDKAKVPERLRKRSALFVSVGTCLCFPHWCVRQWSQPPAGWFCLPKHFVL